ncbi:hypothetical protein KUTeg_011157 [Tegillarca granosa]|uniref:Glycoside hydrolase family 38 N-terminal domain-containing protein n=1 Tax=Tegillarca granosa TaxID=220873 RepID=A0ABQ9F4Y3_TEGGR|nr:hypothetical protein KUTeg_011157 [Tegillarca granosa]
MLKIPISVLLFLLLVADLESASVLQKDVPVTRVHLIFMSHLDVGYDAYIGFIINEYFDTYFPRAISMAEGLVDSKYGERFIYTTHPWLVSLYIDCPPNFFLAGNVQIHCPKPEAIKAFTDAVNKGYITWHAGPMNMQFEMFEPSLANFSLQISADLDKRFGIKRKFRVVSQRDVPGITQAVVPIFESAGIEAISVGVNDRTAPPAFPKIFNWKFLNSSIIGLWNKGGYPDDPGPDPSHPRGLSWNDCATFPGLSHALCFAFRTDNSGPPKSLQEILSNFEVARDFGFVRCVATWQEQRNFSYLAIDALQNHSLAWDLRHELSKLYALKPDLSGYVDVQNKYSDQTCYGFTLQFTPDGALSKLMDPLFNTSWASKTNLLGKFVYQTFDAGDFNYFDRHYAWTGSFLDAVGKRNMSMNASPVSQLWQTSLVNLYRSKEIDVSLQWFGKTTTRLPESLNFVFIPTQNTDGAHWMIHKLGQWIDPLNVVLNGSQRLHVVDRGVYYINSKSQGMEIVSYDAGLVNVLTPDWGVNAFSLPLKPIMSVDGMAFNLYNNLWGTNYIYWYPFEQRDIDQKFRFTLNFESPKSKFYKVYQQKSQALKFVSSLKDTNWKFPG